MIGTTAAAALLLFLNPHTTKGATLSLSQTKRQSLPENSRVGRMLRGQPENADIGVSRSILSGVTAVGHLALLDKCYMTDDCAPGIFMEADFRTQCETTPLFGDDAVCCKPFATPCDSNEACCSGNCSPQYTRCDDALVPSTPPGYQGFGDGQGGSVQYHNDQFHDSQPDDGQNDGGQYHDDETHNSQYDDDQYDNDQFENGENDGGQHHGGQNHESWYDDGQYDDSLSDDGQNDGGQYHVGRYDDSQYGGGQNDGGQYHDGQYHDSQYDDDQYHDSQYDDGQYYNDGGGQNDGSQYHDGQHDDGIVTHDTADDPVLAPTAPLPEEPVSGQPSPDLAHVPAEKSEDDFNGPPLKIDPDGPYAHGRSYSNYDDDHYHGYGRGWDGGEETGPTQAAAQNDEQLENGGDDGTLQEAPVQPLQPSDGGDAPSAPPVDEDGDTGASCVPDYSSGTIDTIASSSGGERIGVVAMDSQGNTFYTVQVSSGDGTVDTIRRVAPPGPSPGPQDSTGGLQHGGDVLVYIGTGFILALAVDSGDNLIFSMEDAPAVSGGVYMLQMAPGGVVLSQNGGEKLGAGNEAPLDDAAPAPAVLLAGGLGPFLPGVAVCPATGDIYVSRGHTGMARLVKDHDGGFSTKVEWDMEDMSFNDKGTTRAPLMVWDIAVNRIGIVYLTTYVQGVVLKAIFPKSGGSAQVRLVAGSWNSGVTDSAGDGGKAVSALMAYPKGIAIDADDAVYITEFQGEKIRKVSSTGIISTIAGTGSTVYEGDGGLASQAGLNLPNAIAFAPGKSGSLMAIADFGHNAVRVVTPISPCA